MEAGKLYGFCLLEIDRNDQTFYSQGLHGYITNKVGTIICFRVDGFGNGRHGDLILIAHEKQFILDTITSKTELNGGVE